MMMPRLDSKNFVRKNWFKTRINRILLIPLIERAETEKDKETDKIVMMERHPMGEMMLLDLDQGQGRDPEKDREGKMIRIGITITRIPITIKITITMRRKIQPCTNFNVVMSSKVPSLAWNHTVLL
jgi:hypothetical protein